MKNAILILLLITIQFSFGQKNEKIDSLNIEIQKLNEKIDLLKTEIKNEILENGYEIPIKERFSFSKLEVLDKKYGKIIDTLKEGEIVKVFEKDIGILKIKYRENKIGVIKTIDYKIENSSPLEYLKDKSFRNTRTHSGKSSYGKSVRIKGHYRTTKSGKRVYVKPHRRKK